MSNDDDLRNLFHETTADIRPQGTYDDIRTRTEKVDPMARSWFLPSMAAATVMALAIGGAVWISRDSDSPTAGPVGTPTTGQNTVDAAVPVYYVGDAAQGERLFREFQQQKICPDDGCLLTAAVEGAVEGTPEDGDYRNPWPAGTTVSSATYDGDVLTVDLSGDTLGDLPTGLRGTGADLAVQQLIYSAQAGLGKGRVPVQLLLNGERAPEILGVPTNEPLAAADDLDVLAPVQISSPGNGATVKAGKVTITGVAAVYEANVTWELLVGGDAVAASGYATAAECCKFSPYEFELDLEGGSTYTLVVHDNDESGEGRPVNQDTKEIVVE